MTGLTALTTAGCAACCAAGFAAEAAGGVPTGGVVPAAVRGTRVGVTLPEDTGCTLGVATCGSLLFAADGGFPLAATLLPGVPTGASTEEEGARRKGPGKEEGPGNTCPRGGDVTGDEPNPPIAGGPWEEDGRGMVVAGVPANSRRPACCAAACCCDAARSSTRVMRNPPPSGAAT